MGSREEPTHVDLMPTPSSAQGGGSIKKCQGQGWVRTICPATHASGRHHFSNFKAAPSYEQTPYNHEPSALKDEGEANGGDGIGISENHLPTADDTCWDKIDQPRLTSEGLRQWEMHAHVDHVFDMVPFWQRGIDAAEKGEVLRLEEFLEKMEGDGGWRTANEVLGMLGGWKEPTSKQARDDGWGQPRDNRAASQPGAWESNAFDWAAASQRGGWGMASNRIASDVTETSRGRDSGWGTREKWAEGGSGLQVGRGEKNAWRARVKGVAAVDGGGGRDELRHFVDAIAQQEAVNEERRRQMHLFFEMPMEQKIKKIEETIRILRTHAA